jgi:hypothetical protein
MATPAVKRQVFAGSAADVARCVSPSAHRADFLSYGETAQYKMNIQLLVRTPELWRALHALQSNLSFQPRKLKQAVEIVWEETRPTWPQNLSDDHRAEWVESVARRLRTALRHLAHTLANGRHRGNTPRWLDRLLGGSTSSEGQEEEEEQDEEGEADEGEEEEEEEEDEEDESDRRHAGEASASLGDGRRPAGEKAKQEEEGAKEGEQKVHEAQEANARRHADEVSAPPGDIGCRPADKVTTEFVYGYCFERGQAWRAPAGSPKLNNREYTDVYAREGALETDFAACRWQDGEEHEVTDLQVAELRARTTSVWNTHRKPLWTGTLGKSTLKLKKACRPTGDAVEIYKTPPGGKETQILQILLDKFDGDQDAKRASGVALGTSLCERLASGTLKESALKEARDSEQRGRASEADAASSGAASSGAAPDTGAALKRRWSSQVKGPGHKKPAEEAPRKRPRAALAAPRKRPAAEEAPEEEKQEEEEEDQGDEEEEAEEEKQKEKDESSKASRACTSTSSTCPPSPSLSALIEEIFLPTSRLPGAGRLELDGDLPSPDALNLSDLDDVV